MTYDMNSCDGNDFAYVNVAAYETHWSACGGLVLLRELTVLAVDHKHERATAIAF